MNNNNFQQFSNMLDTNKPSISDGVLTFPLPIDDSASLLIETLLSDIGYSFDNVRTIRNQKVYISLAAESWIKACPIYNSWEDLFSNVENTSTLVPQFYILDTRQSSFDDTHNKQALEIFCSLRQLLASLADQCEPSRGNTKGSSKLFYIIETDDGVTKYNFKPTLKWSSLKEVSTQNEQLSLVEKMRRLISIGDSQDQERRSVMRSAFHEIISSCHSDEEIFTKAINSIENFHKRYEEHHDLFVRRFSINKVLHEINEKDLTYTSKINEILSSAQNKALTIPAALIVVSAVMRIDQFIDGIAVLVSFLITTIIVYRSLKVHDRTFTHIQKQVNAEFGRYDILNEKVEIRQRATQTKKELSSLLKEAKNNSRFMKCSIWFIFIVAVIFIGIVFYK